MTMDISSPYYLSIFIVLCIGSLRALVYHRRAVVSIFRPSRSRIACEKQSTHVASGLPQATRSRGAGADHDSERPRSLTWKRRAVCCAAAVGYMLATDSVITRSIERYGAAQLRHDSRFLLGRGGMFAAPIMVMLRAITLRNSAVVFREVQADGLTLVVLPFILPIIGTPGAWEENAIFDLLVAPMLGMVVFLTGVVIS
ncbi:hypothetical protein B0H13DRAFT_2659274 [Mycena leptocephala]|nr:hypothetical protein B0H13DRAFT_2659274 [Mycena leptocephala]